MINRRFTRIETELPGPKSAAVLALKEKYVAAPLATYAPFIIKQSEGAPGRPGREPVHLLRRQVTWNPTAAISPIPAIAPQRRTGVVP